MNTRFDFKTSTKGMVYIKPVAVASLPEELRAQAGDAESIFAVHDDEGSQLAYVADRGLAFHLAREHQKNPVAVH